MSLRPPISASPAGQWVSTATIKVPSLAQETSGHPDYGSTSDTSNVPCSIQPASTSESLRFGGGVAHEGVELFTGYFPTHGAGGSAISIPASASVVSDSVTYLARGAGSVYSDGVQTVPLEVVS